MVHRWQRRNVQFSICERIIEFLTLYTGKADVLLSFSREYIHRVFPFNSLLLYSYSKPLTMTKQKPEPNYLHALNKSSYVHGTTFHYLRTGKIPSMRAFYRIDIHKVYNRLIKEYGLTPDKVITSETYTPTMSRNRIYSAYLVVSDKITIAIYMSRQEVELFYSHDVDLKDLEQTESIIIDCVRKATAEKKINLITTDSSGNLETREFAVENLSGDISTLYNDDFAEFNESIIKNISDKKSQGIVLLHGIPGSGKSSYLRYLVGEVQKSFIYLPSNMADNLSQPSFLNFLTRHSNSVLIIEDAEDVLIQRRSGSRSAVANLLNLSDGLLADCLHIQVIATFNTEIAKIDSAFLRKGRILGRYCFQPLSVEKSNALLKQLNSSYITNTPMTLADIFNRKDPDFSKMQSIKEVGFVLNDQQEPYINPF
ncbi:MAG: AAA family ATPase [Bacteroidetes bacterium]|nr:MAG: AAA family ATPase [Bacteroidota bacterium]